MRAMPRKRIAMDDVRLVCHCGGKMEKVRTVWRDMPVRGWRCQKCKDEALHPGDAQRALELIRARDRGEFQVKVRQVGRSLVLTVPRRLAEAYGLEEGGDAEWGVDSDDRLVVRIAREGSDLVRSESAEARN